MAEPMRLLLIEDDPVEVSRFEEYIDAAPDVELIASVGGASDGVRYVVKDEPDALILDLELEEGNGIQFLLELERLSLRHKPYVLVTTRTSAQSTLQSVRDHGAGFIQSKSQPGYGPGVVVDFLRIMRPYFLQEAPSAPPSRRDKRCENSRGEDHLRRRISEEIGRVGIAAGNVGHIYLVDAIVIASREEDGLIDLENVIYPQLMKKHRATKASIERAMRYRIEVAWAATDVEVLERNYTQYISPEKGKPEVRAFIAYYANKFRK